MSLPKLALGVPKVDMSGAPAVMLEGTSPAIQNQICQGENGLSSILLVPRARDAATHLDTLIRVIRCVDTASSIIEARAERVVLLILERAAWLILAVFREGQRGGPRLTNCPRAAGDCVKRVCISGNAVDALQYVDLAASWPGALGSDGPECGPCSTAIRHVGLFGKRKRAVSFGGLPDDSLR